MLVQMRLLHEEQEAIISEIRRMPGFENFLWAAPFRAIQQAASEGPVIVLNHSKYRCDALIVLSREDNPCVCVPLDENFYTDAIKLHGKLLQVRQEFGVASCEYDEIFRRVMKALWDRVVSKVIQKLKQLGVGEESRIWWCPTSVLSAFPFHAAGPYVGGDGSMKYLLDDYISSGGSRKVLFVADTRLRSTKREMNIVYSIRRFKKLIDDRATPEAVLGMLQRVQWVHFGCHGRLDEEPFRSSLELPGGRLTLLDIARANLPNAEFAVLLACHTAEQGPKYALDEARYLAVAMQFCGFRGVVGTMWQVLDRDAPFLSGVVYRQLMNELEEGEVRFKKAAGAVREAALRLRERGDEGLHGERVEIMAERWVNLLHIVCLTMQSCTVFF
ncbi:GSE1_4 [Sanghuangporus weigelae]